MIGNVEIDPKINDLYIRNNKPEFNYCEDLRLFNNRKDLPDALFNLDILDGSPPCTSFSTAGVRERDWGKKKKFREGQATQTLDDLFFTFLDTVELLKPRVVIAENVPGMISGKAKGYVNAVIKRFESIGYTVQIFLLNSAHMDVPQARHRVFFIANRCGFPKLRLDFNHDIILFKDARTESGKPLGSKARISKTLLDAATVNDRTLGDVSKRLTGEAQKYFGHQIIHDRQVCMTITSGGQFYRFCDKTCFSDGDYRNVQSFPQDYDFAGNNVQYVCGMSVPPNMMANVAAEVYNQWLK